METLAFPLFGHYRSGWALFWTLIALLVNALVIGMVDSIRGLEAAWMVPFGLIAVIAGWLMGGIRQKQALKFSLGLISGGLILILFNSGAFMNLYRSLVEALKLFTPLQHAYPVMPKTGPLLFYLYAAASNFSDYFRALSVWLGDFLSSQARFNPLVAVQIWGSLLWSVLILAGWLFRRKHHALVAGLPVLVLLVGIIGYSRQNSTGLIMALTAILFLMVLQGHLARETRWVANHIDFSEELRFDAATLTVPIVLFILIIAAVIPNISLEDIRTFYNEMIRFESDDPTELAESIGLNQAPLDSVSEGTPASLPRSHLIGAGPELSDILVMAIDIGETHLPPQADPTSEIPKYYWYGQSYDIYTGEGWKTSPIRNEFIPANEVIAAVEREDTRILTQTVEKAQGTSRVLFTAGVPQLVDQNITVNWRQATDEYFGAQLDARAYTVTAPILNISEEELQSADEIPPTEILETYLQIPEELPPRVLELAASLGNDSDKPYIKAKTIQNYLRQYEYTLDLPAPPTDQDIVDYFLFELQRGYCDYYASAMVMLARASGLPARMAVGYATGDYDYTRQEFVITEANAHAWPEIYIAPFGWIPFEPTASLRPFDWMSETNISNFPLISTQEPIDSEGTPIWLNLLGLVGLLFAILLIGLFWYWISHKKESGSSTTQQIERLYQRTRAFLTRLFAESDKTKTPLEYRQEMIEYLEDRASSKLDNRLASTITQHLATITLLYNLGIFGPHPLPPTQIKKAKRNWLNLMISSWLLRFVFAFKKS